jgi:hypothetical protein
MSGKRLKQLLLQSAELDDLARIDGDGNGATQKKKNKDRVLSRIEKNEEDKDDAIKDEKEVKLQKQLDSILYYDQAFAKKSRSTKESVKRKMKELSNSKQQRKRIKSNEVFVGTSSNSRSSSSSNFRRKSEPTYNKKRDVEKKRIRGLKDLARQLKKRDKKKK